MCSPDSWQVFSPSSSQGSTRIAASPPAVTASAALTQMGLLRPATCTGAGASQEGLTSGRLAGFRLVRSDPDTGEVCSQCIVRPGGSSPAALELLEAMHDHVVVKFSREPICVYHLPTNSIPGNTSGSAAHSAAASLHIASDVWEAPRLLLPSFGPGPAPQPRPKYGQGQGHTHGHGHRHGHRDGHGFRSGAVSYPSASPAWPSVAYLSSDMWVSELSLPSQQDHSKGGDPSHCSSGPACMRTKPDTKQTGYGGNGHEREPRFQRASR